MGRWVCPPPSRATWLGTAWDVAPLTPLSLAEPPTVRIEHPEVVLRQGDGVNLTCRIAAEPPATGEWVLPEVGPELPVVTKASSASPGHGRGLSQ